MLPYNSSHHIFNDFKISTQFNDLQLPDLMEHWEKLAYQASGYSSYLNFYPDHEVDVNLAQYQLRDSDILFGRDSKSVTAEHRLTGHLKIKSTGSFYVKMVGEEVPLSKFILEHCDQVKWAMTPTKFYPKVISGDKLHLWELRDWFLEVLQTLAMGKKLSNIILGTICPSLNHSAWMSSQLDLDLRDKVARHISYIIADSVKAKFEEGLITDLSIICMDRDPEKAYYNRLKNELASTEGIARIIVLFNVDVEALSKPLFEKQVPNDRKYSSGGFAQTYDLSGQPGVKGEAALFDLGLDLSEFDGL